MAWPKKLLFGGLATLLFMIALEVILAILQVEPLIEDRDPYVGFDGSLPLFVEQSQDGQSYLTTAGNKRDFFNKQTFSRRKTPGTSRVFCLGGSTVFGRPYDDRTSFCGWLRALLIQADPDRNWEVINAGGISYASYRVARVLDELREYSPDVFVIYTGHNEFLEARTYRQADASSGVSRTLSKLVNSSRTASVLSRLVKPSAKSSTGEGLLPAEVEAILDLSEGPDAYHRDHVLRDQIVEHFEFNLSRMVTTALAAGADVILVKPACNLKDFSPFKSEHSRQLDAAKQSAWTESVDRARRLAKQGDIESALISLARAEAIDEDHAELQFLKGTLLFQVDQPEASFEAFRRAVDQDVCPLRALPAIQRIVERVAVAQRVPLVDFQAILELDNLKSLGHRIPGNESFLDHVHPTIDRNRLLALAIIQAMQQRDIVAPRDGWQDDGIPAANAIVESSMDWEVQALGLSNLARVLSWAGKQTEAGPLAMAAVGLREQQELPQDAGAMFMAGVHLATLGRTQDAVAMLEEVVAMKPEFFQARRRLATLLFDDGQLEEAQGHFEVCLTQSPEDNYIRDMLHLIREQN